MLLDLLIILFAISAIYRGFEIGFVRQLFSTLGFFGGLFLGAWLQPLTVGHMHSPAGKAAMTLLTTLGCALLLLTLGEYIGLRLKHKVMLKRINAFDNGLGSILSVFSLLLSAWLLAAILSSLPYQNIKSSIERSHIVGVMNNVLPPAPTVIAGLGHLIDQNGFPQVFIGGEPTPRQGVNVPALGSLNSAVNHDRASVVRIEGQGCGGIVEGTGFVVGSDMVATNAHVVAGIKRPYVEDGNGLHSATPIWFDPDLDFAVLRVSNLDGPSLVISQKHVSGGAPAAVLGYPGGGPFTAEPAAVLDQFTATGRNIYGRGNSERDIYEIRAHIIPGNSGGPLIAQDGTVIGVIFAESTTYDKIGYALTTAQVSSSVNQAAAANQPVQTGRCAE